MKGFLESKLPRFDQPPVGFGICLIPQRQGLLSCVHGGSHVLAHPLGTNEPRLVQERDMPRRVHFTHEVNSSGRNGQALDRNQASQVSGQSHDPNATSHLSRCLALQVGGW